MDSQDRRLISAVPTPDGPPNGTNGSQALLQAPEGIPPGRVPTATELTLDTDGVSDCGELVPGKPQTCDFDDGPEMEPPKPKAHIDAFAPPPPADRNFEWNKRKCKGTPLHEAVLTGDLDAVRELLKGRQKDLEEIAQSRFHYETVFKGKRQEGSGEAIHIAASRGHIEIMELLLSSGSRLDAKVTRDGDAHYDVLHAAVFAEGRKGNLEMVQYLLEKGAPFTKNIDGKTVLHIAYQTGTLALIELIQEESVHRHDGTTEPIEMVRDSKGNTPLEVGFKFSNMSFEEITSSAPFTAGSMRVFLENEPRCIPTFLRRASLSPSIDGDPLKLVEKFEIDMAYTSALITKCPEVAEEFLLAMSGPPECQNPGWHPVPTRMATKSFMNSAYGGHFRRLLNSPPDYFSFYERENIWAFNSEKFEPPKWHNRLASMEPPCFGVTVSVCHVHSMMCAEAMLAISESDDLELFRSRVIGGLIERLWWQGAYRFDFLQVCLNFWALILLTIGVIKADLMPIGDDFAAARGVVGILNEFMEYMGYRKLPDASYFRMGNIIDISVLLNMIALFFGQYMPEQLLLTMRALVVCILWFRLLGFFRCSELMAVVLMPIMRSINSVVPALFITGISFFALCEAYFVFTKGDINIALFSQFGLLFAGNYPVRPDEDIQLQFLLYGGVLVFTIGLLNIFISVISEAYMLEKEKVHLTFSRERASGNLTFLLRASLLPSELLSPRGTVVAMVLSLLVGVAVQALGIVGYYFQYVAVPIFCLVLICLHICVFQEQEAPWPTRNKQPCLRYIWLALPENEDENSSGSTLECIRGMVQKEMKEVKEGHDQIRKDIARLREMVERNSYSKRGSTRNLE